MISIYWLIPIVLISMVIGWELSRKWIEAQQRINDMTPDYPERIPMRGRYEAEVPDVNTGEAREIAMADQILEDQQEVPAEPGRQTHAPAPGEYGFREPDGEVMVIVDPSLKVWIDRQGDVKHVHYDMFGMEVDQGVEFEATARAMSRLCFRLEMARQGIVS